MKMFLTVSTYRLGLAERIGMQLRVGLYRLIARRPGLWWLNLLEWHSGRRKLAAGLRTALGHYRADCCDVDAAGRGMEILTDGELESILDRLDSLKPVGKEISELEDQRDGLLAKGKNVVAGRWIVEWSKSITNYKAKEACQVETWRKKIRKSG